MDGGTVSKWTFLAGASLVAGLGPADWGSIVATLLWILAVILVIAGIVMIVRRQLLFGIVLIIVGLLVGPGGVSVFNV